MREARTRIVADSRAARAGSTSLPARRRLPVWESRWRRPPEPWQRMLGLEATVSYDLRRMAEDWVGPATPVDVPWSASDAVTELAAVARLGGAAGRRPLAAEPWLLGRGRDQQLRWAVNGPLLLVRTERGLRRIGGAHSVPVTSRSRP